MLSDMQSAELRSFHQQLTSARKVLALVGAGLSAASGLPTFRGAGGLWKTYDAFELATPEAFESNPALVWLFYSARRSAALKAKPNAGHRALAELARRWPADRFLTLTQNVDALSERARHPSDSIVHLHGDLFTLRCTSFACSFVAQGDYHQPLTPALGEASINSEDPSLLNIPRKDLPRCPKCHSLMRPGVVWFGETLPHSAIQRADSFISTDEVDLILVVGMSASVWPAAGYIDEVAQRGGKVAVFNSDPAAKRDDNQWFFDGDASEWLPRALEPVIGRVPNR